MISRRALLQSSLVAAAALPASPLRPSLSAQSPSSASSQLSLAVMTYNLRYASDTPPNAWPKRRPIVRDLLRQYQPDLFGTQEGLFRQLKDLSADLPEYHWIGLGRDGGSRGEFMAIFYRHERFEVLEYDHFWLSDTPEVMGSSTWGNSNRRMVTTARFRDRSSGRAFHFWNTHLDHQLQPAREKSALLIRERMKKADPSLPLILLGDFNAVATQNPVYDMLTKDAGLIDTWFAAKERRNAEHNSFNNFAPPQRDGHRIDWILSRTPPTVEVAATEIITYAKDDQFPSDHFPIQAWLKY